MQRGEVLSIHIGPEKGADMVGVESVRALAGKGLEGDRYAAGDGTFAKLPEPKRQATLIESEAIAAAAGDYDVALSPGQSRRNITTRGVALNHLVGRELMVGEVRLRGVKLCEPCGRLEKLTRSGVRKAFAHRGGLRAEILNDGTIRVGDTIAPCE